MKLVDPSIEEYCAKHSLPLPSVFSDLREATYANTTAPQMQVGFLEGSFLQFLIRITQAKKILEFGTFTGYSSLAMALALPEDGKVITCDVDPRATEIAKQHWEKANCTHKIELKLGPALESLKTIKGPLDMVFIDADKANYQNYWDQSLPLVRKGGIIVVDNVLWSGRVLQPQDKSDHHIADFNLYAHKDSRVRVLMLPIRDGMLLAEKL